MASKLFVGGLPYSTTSEDLRVDVDARLRYNQRDIAQHAGFVQDLDDEHLPLRMGRFRLRRGARAVLSESLTTN